MAAPITTPWTADLVARRAVDFVRAQSALRSAKFDYFDACDRYRVRHGLARIDRDDAKFHRATRKTYRAVCEARHQVRNAKRRLETAVRRLDHTGFRHD
jgi:hypothetical protein